MIDNAALIDTTTTTNYNCCKSDRYVGGYTFNYKQISFILHRLLWLVSITLMNKDVPFTVYYYDGGELDGFPARVPNTI